MRISRIKKPQGTSMDILIERLSTLVSFIKETFDLDPANLWLR
jgi:hypothetical protein